MIIRCSVPLRLTHRHDDVDIGPESRPHSHDLVLDVSIGGIGFDPATGGIIDSKLGPSSIDELRRRVGIVADRYDGSDLADIPGIRPTVSSLVLSVRERYLLLWPSVEVSIRCPAEGWEVQA